MSFHFDINKVVQAAAVVLKNSPKQRMNYTAFIKLMYLADRKSLQEVGTPITGDTPHALDKGPVLSRIMDLIKDTDYKSEVESAIWSKWIQTVGFDIELLDDPGDSELSEYEISLLNATFEEHGRKPLAVLLSEVHALKEWIECYQEHTSTPISLKAILSAVDRDDDYSEISLKKIEDATFARLFGEGD